MSEILYLWPDGVPGSDGWTQQETDYVFQDPIPERIVRNVTNPSLVVHLPEPGSATGAGVIIAPGGAFHLLAIENEGIRVAQWLNAHGIAAFILKYRVLETPAEDAAFLETLGHINTSIRNGDGGWLLEKLASYEPLAIADGQQAVRIVRERAQEWGVRPGCLGMLGFSAGGHLVSNVVLANEPESQPDFVASIYGGAIQEIVVPEDAPPLFTVVASDDRAVGVDAQLALYSAWHAAGQSAELHIYSRGDHGFGMKRQGLPSDTWIDRFWEWLQVEGFIPEEKQ